jgi:hypothetical protein
MTKALNTGDPSPSARFEKVTGLDGSVTFRITKKFVEAMKP